MANERPIPQAALRDATAVEILRVWIAEKKLHCSLKVGMYRETTNVPDRESLGNDPGGRSQACRKCTGVRLRR